MNKEILRRNIEQVIMQPCNAKYPDHIESCGLSEDGKYIMVKTSPDDSSSYIWLERNGEKRDYIQQILKKLPEKYRDHLVTLRHNDWVYYSYLPVFDTDTQALWDKEFDDYIADKAAWCAKYGCD